MRKRLLAIGCAGTALCFGGAPAFAQAKFGVKIGGDAYFTYGFISQTNAPGLSSTEATNRVRLNIVPTAKADNGLEYGGRLRLRTQKGTGVIDADRVYVFARGDWGRIDAGLRNGLGDDFGNLGPLDDYSGGGLGSGIDTPNEPFDDYLRGSAMGEYIRNSVILNEYRGISSADKSTRIFYLSPRFGGFNFGIGYMPRSDSKNTDVNRVQTGASADLACTAGNTQKYCIWEDAVEVGGTYLDKFGDWTLDADAFYISGTTRPSAGTSYSDLKSIKLGFDVRYQNVKFGGSYVNGFQSGYQIGPKMIYRADQVVYTLGIAYLTDAFAVGANYTHAEDQAALNVPGKAKFDIATVGATYNVAPGLALNLEYDYVGLSIPAGAAAAVSMPASHANVLILRTSLAF